MTHEKLETEEAALTIYSAGPEWDGVPTATIGDFKCRTLQAGVEILKDATARIRASGRERVLGPMSGDTWHNYRFVSESDGSPPFLLEPRNKPHERDAFLATGFAPVSHYFSASLSLDQWTSATPPPTEDYVIESWDGSNPEDLFREVFSLSLRAFAKNAFYTPITEDAFLALYMPMVPIIKPNLIFLARRPNGSLAGFLFSIPDYTQGPGSRTLIIKTYASLERGAGRHLLYACQFAARALGFQTVIHALMHDANQSAERSAREGATIFRRYELLGLRWDE